MPIRWCPNVHIVKEMLSDTLLLMLDVTGVAHYPCTKLVSNCVTRRATSRTIAAYSSISPTPHWKDTRHCCILSAHLHAAFIKFCNNGRKNAQSDFESSLYKLIANEFYGKTVENMHKRANVRLIADPAKFVRSVSKASHKHLSRINEDLAMVENFRAKAVLLKPITVGCAILEFVKLLMYKFYYDCLLPTFGDRLRLCFTYTDSFICHIQSEDLVGELGAIWTRQISRARTRSTRAQIFACGTNSSRRQPTYC